MDYSFCYICIDRIFVSRFFDFFIVSYFIFNGMLCRREQRNLSIAFKVSDLYNACVVGIIFQKVVRDKCLFSLLNGCPVYLFVKDVITIQLFHLTMISCFLSLDKPLKRVSVVSYNHHIMVQWFNMTIKSCIIGIT